MEHSDFTARCGKLNASVYHSTSREQRLSATCQANATKMTETRHTPDNRGRAEFGGACFAGAESVMDEPRDFCITDRRWVFSICESVPLFQECPEAMGNPLKRSRGWRKCGDLNGVFSKNSRKSSIPHLVIEDVSTNQNETNT